MPGLMDQNVIGLSGVIFGLILIDNASLVHLSLGAAQRSIFGLFSVPAPAYPWALLLIWTLLMPEAFFLCHLSGLLVRLTKIMKYKTLLSEFGMDSSPLSK